MSQFRKLLNESRDKSVPAEFRIAIGQLKRLYNPGEIPKLKELTIDAEAISKKNKLDTVKFLDYAKEQFKINEGEQNDDEDNYEDDKDLDEVNRAFPKNASNEDKADIVMGRCKKFRIDSAVGYMINDDDIISAVKLATGWDWKESEKYFEDNYKKVKMNERLVDTNITIKFIDDGENEYNAKKKEVFKKKNSSNYDRNLGVESYIKNKLEIPKYSKDKKQDDKRLPHFVLNSYANSNEIQIYTYDISTYNALKSKIQKLLKVDEIYELYESAVGAPGRTTVKDAEDHINDDLVAEFKKIIKKLGGKTVAKVLLDKLGQKAEIKDEIEHIEDIIDNSNY